jgi:dolichol-phosphate mannosyltransferase
VGWKVRLLTAFRFGLVGVSGLMVNEGLLWAWVTAVRGHYLVGAVVATQGSTLWNFLLLERWVFLHAKARRPLVRLISFATVNNSTLLLRIPLLALLTSGLHIFYLISNAITLLVLFALRFVLSDRFIWKESDLPTAASVARVILDDDERRERSVPRMPVGTGPVPSQTIPRTRRSPAGLPHTYDVGGLVAIGSAVRLRELQYFRVPELERPADIELRVRPVGSPGLRLRPLVTFGPTFVAYDEHLGRLGANFRLDFQDRIHVTVGPLLARSPHVLYNNVVEALLRFVLVSRDRILLHSATVELEGRGVMLTARTDTGKTSTVLRLLRERGAAFLSDDMTIVEASGLAHCYPKPLTISAHTLKAVNRGSLHTREQLKLAVQSRMHSKQGRSIGSRLGDMNLPIMALNSMAQVVVPPPKYMVDRLVRCRLAGCAAVQEAFVIERGPCGVEEVDLARAVDLFVANTDDAYGFPPFRYFAPAIAIDGQDYGRLRERERELLTRFLAGVRVRRVSRDDFGWADEIPQLLTASGGSTS